MLRRPRTTSSKVMAELELGCMRAVLCEMSRAKISTAIQV